MDYPHVKRHQSVSYQGFNIYSVYICILKHESLNEAHSSADHFTGIEYNPID
jgi:hypothetical protein